LEASLKLDLSKKYENGPPEMRPAPLMAPEYIKCSWLAMKAPAENPEMVTPLGFNFSCGNFYIYPLILEYSN
jgi:hypothetical protein